MGFGNQWWLISTITWDQHPPTLRKYDFFLFLIFYRPLRRKRKYFVKNILEIRKHWPNGEILGYTPCLDHGSFKIGLWVRVPLRSLLLITEIKDFHQDKNILESGKKFLKKKNGQVVKLGNTMDFKKQLECFERNFKSRICQIRGNL